ncbi:hypothetical protein S7711_04660 [Stachybotrys chartarum IBT 7711]|uniref:Uncharacterized protein n=1 Tax=Stachybotrys chartarum (strain CBS 109288 / IBT 7711) TaxID=1280523 RepID=A0A084B617_STACB|nr:hypothetical protein S7711_04660 [Stachybotrys chartarum IBT 7711]KFA55670.1 hypothetical protein S40293_05280 [Stachybotrys chartarum IBT 40293]KFA81363.1 hypothetical protein S40288_06048 [Stachybotrys chartarum IBT 40288]
MAPSFVTIDTSDDFAPAVKGSPKRTLLLAPPSVAAHEDKLRAVFTSFDRAATDLQMLDRVSAGLATLPPAAYDAVLVLTDDHDSAAVLDRKVFAALVPAMKVGARLETQNGRPLGKDDAREAILAGLVGEGARFEKVEEEEVVVPLKLGLKKKSATVAAPPVAAVPNNGVVTMSLDDLDDVDDDDIIDEDTLMTEDDLKRPIQQPPECQPKPGRRRRACKDCTCGLAEQIEKEDAQRRAAADTQLNTFKLASDDLNELDFTVQGKTGSCGNCALGDAFRCDGCPYIGLPPFKPGEEVRLLNDVAQL